MPFFRYEAIDRAGKDIRGSIDAPTEAEARARLSARGYQVRMVHAPAAPAAPAALAPTRQPRGIGRAGARDCALFYRQMAAQVRAGISVYQALETLQPRVRQRNLARASRAMADAARMGGRISDVMASHPRLFPEHVTGAIRAGELGGFLEIVLDEIALDYEQEMAFYKNTALWRLLIGQQALAVAVVQPVFPTIVPDQRVDLFLRIVITRNLPIAVAALVGVRFLWWFGQEPQFRHARDAAALRVPVFGRLTRQRSLAAFIRALRRLYAAGLSPQTAWQGAAAVAPNHAIRARLEAAYLLIQQNVPIHDAFSATRLFSDEAEQLLATGVVSGQTVEMLDRIADHYQDNVDRAFSSARFWMFRLSSTMFIALMGAVAIIFTKGYFDAPFRWVEQQFGEP